MDELDPAQLAELISVLRNGGVTEFSCPAFSLRLAPVAMRDDADPDIARVLVRREQEALEKRQKLGPYAHPSLWPDGSPPSFAGSRAAESPFKEV